MEGAGVAVGVTVGVAVGVAVGVTDADDADAAEVPTALLAVTVKVYAVSFVRPVTVQERAPVVHAQLAPPGLAVTV